MLNSDRYIKFANLVLNLKEADDEKKINHSSRYEDGRWKERYTKVGDAIKGTKTPEDSVTSGMGYAFVFTQLAKSEKYSIVDKDVNFLNHIKLPKDLTLSHLRLPSPLMYIDVDIGDARGILLEETHCRLSKNDNGKPCYVIDRLSTLKNLTDDLEKRTENITDPTERAERKRLLSKIKNKHTEENWSGSLDDEYKVKEFFMEYDEDDIEMPETFRVLRIWYRWKKDGNEFIQSTGITLDDTGLDAINTKRTTVVKEFLYKFLLFIMEPDVSTFYRDDNYLSKRNIKRKERGKTPIPAFHVVTVTGVLKRVIGEIRKSVDKGLKMGHKFSVIAHWRHFWNQKRYKRLYAMSDKQLEKEGYAFAHYYPQSGNPIAVIRKFVAEYVKGEGIYVKKQRKVKTDDGKKKRFKTL